MKPTDADRDPAFDRLIARGLERETDASGNACPDADLLAAWFDHSLSALETERIEAHASSCAHCQQILADLARSEPEVTRAAPVPAPARPWHWHWRWLVPLATAAVVVVVGTRTLRAPGEVLIPASTPPPAIGGRPSTWVELQQAPSPTQPSAQGAGGIGAPAPAGRVARNVPTAPVGRLEEPKREAARAEQKAQPAAPNADTPRNLAAAESIVSAVPPSGAAPAPPIVRAADERGVRAPRYVNRELAAPLLSTSGTGDFGATATWRYGQGGVVERSTDGGQTWDRQASGVTTALIDGSAPTDRVCWIVGARGVVLRTIDGHTWQRLTSPTSANLVSVHAWSDSSATITASDRSEYETTDGGTTWRKR